MAECLRKRESGGGCGSSQITKKLSEKPRSVLFPVGEGVRAEFDKDNIGPDRGQERARPGVTGGVGMHGAEKDEVGRLHGIDPGCWKPTLGPGVSAGGSAVHTLACRIGTKKMKFPEVRDMKIRLEKWILVTDEGHTGSHREILVHLRVTDVEDLGG